MKKLFLIIVGMACCFNQVSAIKLGLKAGVNFDRFPGKLSEFDKAVGAQVGGIALFQLPLGFALQPELLYTFKQTKIAELSLKDNFHYVEVPLNLQCGISLFGLVRPFVMAGPSFGYAFAFSDGVDVENFNKYHWGFGLGAGLEVWKLQFTVRYSFGLNNFEKSTNTKSNTCTIALGYFFK